MRFVPNQPFDSPRPTVVVDAGLPLGPHTFRLQVENQRGQRSAPIEFVVTIVRLEPVPPLPIPTPIPIPRPPII